MGWSSKEKKTGNNKSTRPEQLKPHSEALWCCWLVRAPASSSVLGHTYQKAQEWSWQNLFTWQPLISASLPSIWKQTFTHNSIIYPSFPSSLLKFNSTGNGDGDGCGGRRACYQGKSFRSISWGKASFSEKKRKMKTFPLVLQSILGQLCVLNHLSSFSF